MICNAIARNDSDASNCREIKNFGIADCGSGIKSPQPTVVMISKLKYIELKYPIRTGTFGVMSTGTKLGPSAAKKTAKPTAS